MQVIGTAIFNLGMFFYSGLQAFQFNEYMNGSVDISKGDFEVMYWVGLAFPVAITECALMGLFFISMLVDCYLT